MLMFSKLSLTEKAVLILVLVAIALGFVFFFTNTVAFDRYVVEDGVVEWLTVLGLLLGAFVCFGRFFKLLGKRSWIFLTITLLLGLLLFVVAGEEISWGQRQLGIEPSEYFKKNNLQKETNFHNLVVNGVKINKVVFSVGLIVVLSIYLIIFPLLYRRNAGFQRWVDSWGIILPQTYQIISFLLLFGVTALMKHEKNAELLECGAGLLFFLIVRFPYNGHIFKRKSNHITA